MSDADRRVPVERQLFLRSLTIAQPNGSAGWMLASNMRDVYFRRDERLFKVGEPSSRIYFLASGTVRLDSPTLRPWDFEAPAVVGVIDAVAQRLHTREAIAMTDVHALSVGVDDWMVIFEEHFDFARNAVTRGSLNLLATHLSLGDGSFPKIEPAAPAGMPSSGLNLFERVLSLRASPLFHNAGVQATLLLAECAKEIDLDPDEKLYTKDDVLDCIHVVAGGAIRVEREEPVLRASFGPGAWVGGGSALGIERAAFDAYAEGPAVVLAIDREDLFDIMEDHFDLTRSLLAGFNLERERILDEHGVLSDAQIARGERASLLPQRVSVRLA